MINDDVFSPATVTIGTGQEVMWMNLDVTNHHTIVADNGEFKSGDLTPAAADKEGNPRAGGVYHFRFDKPGAYTYHCGLHSSMTGTVIVK